MDLFSELFPALLGLALGIVFFNGAITGKFYTHKRDGGHSLIATVQSVPLCALSFLISIGGWLTSGQLNL